MTGSTVGSQKATTCLQEGSGIAQAMATTTARGGGIVWLLAMFGNDVRERAQVLPVPMPQCKPICVHNQR